MGALAPNATRPDLVLQVSTEESSDSSQEAPDVGAIAIIDEQTTNTHKTKVKNLINQQRYTEALTKLIGRDTESMLMKVHCMYKL